MGKDSPPEMNMWWVGRHFSFQILSWLNFDNSEFLPEVARLEVVGEKRPCLRVGRGDEHGCLPFSCELCDLNKLLNLSKPYFLHL